MSQRPERQWLGIYTGIVTANRVTDLWIKAKVPQVMGDVATTTWAAPAGFQTLSGMAGLPRGLGLDGTELGPGPNVGDIVLLMFVGGDIRVPVYLATSQALR